MERKAHRKSTFFCEDFSMRMFLTFVLLFCLVVLVPGPARSAPECLIGPGLGATLLYPYFEVDTANPFGKTTLLAINNGLSGEAITRVVLWTDWGTPTMAFDVYLKGFDVVTINMRDVFNGNVPSTGAGEDLSAFDGCATSPPTYSTPVGTADQRTQLFADHTGVQGPLFSSCVASQSADGLARGYVTVDQVTGCSGMEEIDALVTPRRSDYFTTLAGQSNRLWGDLIYVDPANASAHASEAVALWADAAMFAGPNVYTFYGRFVGWNGSDARVPLPELWDQRFLNGGPFAGGADLIVFRDPGRETGSGTCGTTPAPFPLDTTITSLDEDAGNILDLSLSDALGLATQRVSISELSIPYSFGWLQIGSSPYGSWVQPVLSASGLYSAGFNGTPVNFLCSDTPPTIMLPVTGNSSDERPASVEKRQ